MNMKVGDYDSYIMEAIRGLALKVESNSSAYRLIVALHILRASKNFVIPLYGKTLIADIIEGKRVCPILATDLSNRLLHRAKDFEPLRRFIKSKFYPELGIPISLKSNEMWKKIPITLTPDHLDVDLTNPATLKWLDTNCYLFTGNLRKLMPD